MSIQFATESGSNILTAYVSRKLDKEDYADFVPEFERLLREPGKLRLLLDMTAVYGWQAAAAEEDLKLGLKHFADIERIAIVGASRWQHGMESFCKPFTKAAVWYFNHRATAEAREWLAET